jgi:hypothetical protein
MTSTIAYESKSLTCPFCGELMEPGSILGTRHPLRWQPRDRPTFSFWPTGHRISRWRGLFGRPKVHGWRCAKCRRIIVDEAT